MGIQTRRGVRKGCRPGFDLRRTAFGFAFLALLIGGGGLALRTALKSAEQHPVAAVFSVALLVAGVWALLRMRRSRRAAARAAAAAVETAYEVVDAALEELPEAETAPLPAPAPPPVDYAAMDPYAFEEAVAALCRRDGCLDAEVVGGAGDLGADVLATTPDGRRLVVQCKRYTCDNKVGSQDLQRFGGTCYAVHEAEVALVVSTGEFTEPALEYAEQCGIVCVGPDELTAWSEGAAAPPWYAGAPVQPAEG
ncbi:MULTISPECIES: restriction endonuclease [unclassified Streptomyces]|uniref:Restriction endonuclease n=1 Tax=Streptomyces sp. gb1(2016) TaxID=1828321 RepID=A0A652KXZ7_9ACTN|nr:MULTISPECIES: restriction endonuclease [unclassified Streptomyces]TXS28491.1 restriction endonuclease [Streptomyces sp. gb1(2016)]